MQLKIGKAGGRDFGIDAQELVTGRTCIIAQSGAGKSWSIAVLCEKMCSADIGFCLIDTEGEYYSLKEKYDKIWWVGAEGADAECEDIELDYDIERVNLKHLIERAVAESRPVIFDVSDVDMIPRVTRLVHILYDVSSEQRKPYLLIVEEADKFIPQSRDSIKKIEEISRRGRKRGLGLMVATQRPAIVTKNVLSQCNSQIIGKLSIDNDLRAVGLFFSSKQEVEELTTLVPGDFFVMGTITHEKTKMRFGRRLTKHRGLTPMLEERVITAETVPEDEPDPEDEISFKIDSDAVIDEEDKNEKKPEKIPAESIKTPEPKPKRKRSKPKPRLDLKGGKNCIIPVLTRDEVLDVVYSKLKKRRFGIGIDERLLSAEIFYRPVFYVMVRYIKRRILRGGSTQETSFYLDGLTGDCIDISRGIEFRQCFSEYLGLDEDSIIVIDGMPVSGETSAEIEARTRFPRKAVDKAISSLLERKLITNGEAFGESGEVKYVPLAKQRLPHLGAGNVNSDFRFGIPEEGEVIEETVQKDDIRTILKAIEPTSEILEFKAFYYPIYEIRTSADHEEKTFYIDALKGKEVRLT